MPSKAAFEFVRFTIVGVINTGICLLCAWTLHGRLGVALGTASAAGYLAGATNSYLLNRYWTFDAARAGRQAIQLPMFALVSVIGSAAYAALVTLLARAVPAGSAAVAALVAITVFNFFVVKLVVFRPARSRNTSRDG